ncbi:uncharacterized protein ACIB01_004168 isoform 2-T2 [Guaruba guarouba]
MLHVMKLCWHSPKITVRTEQLQVELGTMRKVTLIKIQRMPEKTIKDWNNCELCRQISFSVIGFGNSLLPKVSKAYKAEEGDAYEINRKFYLFIVVPPFLRRGVWGYLIRSTLKASSTMEMVFKTLWTSHYWY